MSPRRSPRLSRPHFPLPQLTKEPGEVANAVIACGHGNQVLRWLAFASCERLAHIAGIAPGTFVPQAVLNQEGVALDVDTVIKELFADGDTVSVRFGPGPEAFTVPWDGRSPDPPFRWGADGEIATESELDWLERDLDLYAFGVDDLVNESLAASTPEARADDVAATHATLVSHGGVLQALFTLYESKGDVDARDVSRMNLEQFRQFTRDCKATTAGPPSIKAECLDECFNEVMVQNRKGAKRTTTNESSIQIDAFFVAVLRVAARKYDVATAKEQGFAELHVRLDHFVKTHVIPNVGSVFEANHDQLKGCADDEVLVLLGRARRLTKLAMTSCLLRRPPTLEQTLDVRYLTAHMHKWDLLCPNPDDPRDVVTYDAYAKLIVFVKQNGARDVRDFKLVGWPYRLEFDEFERLLTSLGWLLWNRRNARLDAEEAEAAAAKKAKAASQEAEDEDDGDASTSDEEGEGADAAKTPEAEKPPERRRFVPFLGEFLDGIFRDAGVLPEEPNDADTPHGA